MPKSVASVAIPAGAAILGGVMGGLGSKGQSSQSNSESQLFAAPETEQERQAREMAFSSIGSLDTRLKSLQASPVLNNLDQLLQEMGKAPTQARISESQATAAQLFAPQQTALDQAMSEQQLMFANRAAQMGRSSADPILAARMAQEQVRQRARLASEQGSYAAQEALNAPGRMFQSQLAGVTGLQDQAIQNRQAIFNLGSTFANSLQQYRLATGRNVGVKIGQQSGEPGGWQSALTGALQGASGGVNIARAAGMFSPAAAPSSYTGSNQFGSDLSYVSSVGNRAMPRTIMLGN